MATYSRKLKDASGNYIVPATRSSCIYLNDDVTLQIWADAVDLKMERFEKTLESISINSYPVGSIYQSTNSTSPASLFGGDWMAIHDRFLYGSGTKTAGETGGEETHVLTINEMPSHNHNGITTKWQSWVSTGPTCGPESGSNFVIDYNGGFTTNNTGGNWAHNNMPPYEVVYIWKRVA